VIVREREGAYVLITQHDHAMLSGWLAVLWGNRAVPAPAEPAGPLCLAAALHDVGWTGLDRRPAWNEAEGRPYSFEDLPYDAKLPGRRAGVDRVEAEDAYAALLCSKHYPGLFPSGMRGRPDVAAFVAAEEARQRRLAAALLAAGRTAELDRVEEDLQLLRLWDEISLYVAMNEPGVSGEQEHPWFRHGFGWTAPAGDGSRLRFRARWLDSRRVALDPFPLREARAYALPYRLVSKEAIGRLGFQQADAEAAESVQVIQFVPEPG
jgi:hypothetical protein